MLLTRTTDAIANAVNRTALSLFVVLIGGLVFTADSVLAASIFSDYSITSADLRNSLEQTPGDIGLLESSTSGFDDCGCGAASADGRIDVLPTGGPTNQESPNQVEFAPANNRGGTTSSESSPTGGFAGGAAAMLGTVFDRPAGELIAWLSIEHLLDIPPAPPFELLRPPQFS